MAKKALLIGINRYRVPGADLRGCVNDVNDMAAILKDFFGFSAGDIVTLTDYAATKRAMQAGIKALLKGAKAGDQLLLHYSGHGANVPDDDTHPREEADGRDEILCPTDLDWNDPLRDDWLRETFDAGLKAGANLTVIMDCCHSGTNTRQLAPPDAPSIPRYLPSPWELINAESGRKSKVKRVRSVRASSKAARGKSDVVNADIPELLITGCRDTQTSADAYISGRYNGALTHGLVATLRQAKGKVSNRELHAGTTERLRRGRFEQVPQLEGRKAQFDRPFLS